MKVYTVKEVAEILHIGKNKAYALMNSSIFPSYRLNKNLYVTEESLKEWLTKIKGKNISI